ncbi:MAG: ABC transporter permease [Candidatus Coatesbacteria bacterium]|nr:ABC transporter permease [Candidatus Coatesbacteria bacterium]
MIKKLLEPYFNWIGTFSIFFSSTLIRLSSAPHYLKEILEQIYFMGNRSLPLITVTSAFTGMVTAIQTFYQLEDYTPQKFVGSVVGKTLLIELGPVLTSLLISGRVGAAIAAELGTMKVTEQIDAIETLAIDPIKYLVVPRFVAGLIVLPALGLYADWIGVFSGWYVSVYSLGIDSTEYIKGVQDFCTSFDLFFGLLKAFIFGGVITLVSCFEGFNTRGGAEGVGIHTTRGVVISSLFILLLDFFIAHTIL